MMIDIDQVILLIANILKAVWIRLRIWFFDYGFVPMGVLVSLGVAITFQELVAHFDAVSLWLLLKTLLSIVVFFAYIHHAIFRVRLLIDLRKDGKKSSF